MTKTMSLASRREMLISFKESYLKASWLDKGKILDGFVAASHYDRKYAIRLLNRPVGLLKPKIKRTTRVVYDEQVKRALLSTWYAANQICSKRLVPFLPELVEVLERHDHLQLPEAVRKRLLAISHSSVDRLLRSERRRINKSITTTTPGSLFKHRIQIRTFADWNDVIPGFVEADLVAHCGGNTTGSFLNTLVLVDISTGWLECLPLLRKSSSEVITGLRVAADLLPFTLLGLDTDNGSEFINHDLLHYCEDNNITFTRSRAYKKNDQAHVEEKNGSVVRRLVGYDRFEGHHALEALTRLYAVMRLYVNFFQPSLKLLSKERSGPKVTKKYSVAKTAHQRIMRSEHVTSTVKENLSLEYRNLDPVALLGELESLQDQLWRYAWCGNKTKTLLTPEETKTNPEKTPVSNVIASFNVNHGVVRPGNRFYSRKVKIDLRKAARTWRTRKDPFEEIWAEIRPRLELNPGSSPTALLKWLMAKYPGKFKRNQLRSLQRRVCEWKNEQRSEKDDHKAFIPRRDLLKPAPLSV